MKKTVIQLLKESFEALVQRFSPGKPKKPEESSPKRSPKLSRKELLEVLVKQSQRIEDLEAQLKEAEEKLAQRELILTNAGSLAEAALKLNRIFEDADAACQQYRDSLKALAEKPSARGEGEIA